MSNQTRIYMPLKIRHKLFLAILVANTLLILCVYLAGSWIFSTSFRDYLDANEARRLAPLTEELAVLYAERGNWRWVRDRQNREWPELMRRYASDFQPPPKRSLLEHEFQPPRSEDGDRRPPPGGRPRPPPGYLLQTAEKRLVIGRFEDIDRAHWITINSNQEIVGYLGFVRPVNITDKLDDLFITRINQSFVWMALGILILSSIISIPLSRRIVKPIEQLRQASGELASGNYQVSVNSSSQDEIGQLTKDFNSLAKTLARNLRARQQWIADISHELRTPVAVLQGEIEAVQDQVRRLDRSVVDSLHHEVLRLSRLINDLHELSMSDLGALSYQVQRFDLVPLVEDVVSQYRPVLSQQSISIDFNSIEEEIEVSADYRRLEQLFGNLAINSRHYTLSPGKVEVEIIKQHDRVIVRWSDSAPGVSDTELDHLFDRLYRVESSRNRNSGGSGLGLAICKNIAEASQGTITAEPSSLGGLTFIVILPVYA